MRIHRFIDPKQRDAAKRGANRSCKALNLSLETINLRRFAHIESWIRQGNTLSLKRYRIVIPQATTLFLIEKNPDVESAFREKRRRRTGAPPYCILNRTEHSDYIRHRSILVRNNYCIIIKIRFEMTNPYTTNFDFSNRL